MSTVAPCSTAVIATTASPADPANESVTLGEIIAHFSGIVFAWMLLLIVISASGRFAGTLERRKYHSRMMPEAWPLLAKDTIAMLMLLFGVVPWALFLVSIVFGALLAPIEDWSFDVAFEYCLSNVAGLANPLTSVVPASPLGDFASIMISIWAMLICSSMMGIAGNMGVIQRLITDMPGSFAWFVFYIFVAVPVLLVIVAFILGACVAAAEDWGVVDGFLFMIGSLCGLANPLTAVVPASPHGVFLEILASVSEVALGGAIVGVVGAHPVCDKFVAYLEGEGTLLKNLATARRKVDRIGHFLGKDESVREKTSEAAAVVVETLEAIPGQAVDLATRDLSKPDPAEVDPAPAEAPSDLRLATAGGGAEPPDLQSSIEALRTELAQTRADLAAAEERAEKAERRANLAERPAETNVYLPVDRPPIADVSVSRADNSVVAESAAQPMETCCI